MNRMGGSQRVWGIFCRTSLARFSIVLIKIAQNDIVKTFMGGAEPPSRASVIQEYAHCRIRQAEYGS